MTLVREQYRVVQHHHSIIMKRYKTHNGISFLSNHVFLTHSLFPSLLHTHSISVSPYIQSNTRALFMHNKFTFSHCLLFFFLLCSYHHTLHSISIHGSPYASHMLSSLLLNISNSASISFSYFPILSISLVDIFTYKNCHAFWLCLIMSSLLGRIPKRRYTVIQVRAFVLCCCCFWCCWSFSPFTLSHHLISLNVCSCHVKFMKFYVLYERVYVLVLRV